MLLPTYITLVFLLILGDCQMSVRPSALNGFLLAQDIIPMLAVQML